MRTARAAFASSPESHAWVCLFQVQTQDMGGSAPALGGVRHGARSVSGGWVTASAPAFGSGEGSASAGGGGGGGASVHASGSEGFLPQRGIVNAVCMGGRGGGGNMHGAGDMGMGGGMGGPGGGGNMHGAGGMGMGGGMQGRCCPCLRKVCQRETSSANSLAQARAYCRFSSPFPTLDISAACRHTLESPE